MSIVRFGIPCLLLFARAISLSQDHADEPTRLIAEIRHLLGDGKHSEARARIDSALHATPDDPALVELSGSAYHLEGNLPAALKAFENMADLLDCDTCHAAYDSLAVIYTEMKKPDDAKDVLVKAVKAGSLFARETLAKQLTKEADAFVDRSEFEEALKVLEKAARLSDDTLITERLALTFRFLGKNDECRKTCMAILKRYPDSPFALQQLESLYFQEGLESMREGMYRNAITSFEKSCEFHPMWGKALIRMGACYELLRDTQRAFSNYSNAIFDSSVMTEAKTSVARVYRGWGKYNQAYHLLQEAINADPGDIWLWDELGRLYRDVRKREEFFECWKVKLGLGDYSAFTELREWGVPYDTIHLAMFPWLEKNPFARPGNSGDDPTDFVPVDEQPKIVEMATPEYPDVAKRIGAEGVVWVKLLVGLDGIVKKAVILKSDNDVLNVSAYNAALKYKFTPAMMNGKPVAVWVSQPFRFKLSR